MKENGLHNEKLPTAYNKRFASHSVHVCCTQCKQITSGETEAGSVEDPATGSGNSAFGYYMLQYGIWDGKPVTIEQGGKDRIFNTVHLAYRNSQLLFGGKATTRIKGVYYV